MPPSSIPQMPTAVAGLRVLAFAEPSQQHELAIREFQRIVMHMRLIHVELSEASHPFTSFLGGLPV